MNKQEITSLVKQAADMVRANSFVTNKDILSTLGLIDEYVPENGDKFSCYGWHCGSKKKFVAEYRNGALYDEKGVPVNRVYLKRVVPI